MSDELWDDIEGPGPGDTWENSEFYLANGGVWGADSDARQTYVEVMAWDQDFWVMGELDESRRGLLAQPPPPEVPKQRWWQR